MSEKDLYLSVAVLMSTYNGERYIEEQIDSILTQKSVNVFLYIRDDGSKDNTINIINQYINKYPNIKLIEDHTNLGPGMSFLSLLQHVVTNEALYDYYAFADQDDVWLEEKLIKAINTIKPSNKPVLYCSNQWIFKNGIVEGKRFNTQPDLSLKGHMTRNVLSGCTYVFNQQLALLIVHGGIPDKNILLSRCHDSWVFTVAILVGNVIYDHDSMIKYRIHDNNTIGVRKNPLLERLQRFVKQQNANKDIGNISMKQARSLRIKFAGYYSDKDKSVLDEFADYRDSLTKRLKLMFDKSASTNSGQNHLLFMFKVLVGYI